MPVIQEVTASHDLALPADVWGVVARATLQAEGGDVHAWERLSRVNSVWRAGVKGDSRACINDRVTLSVIRFTALYRNCGNCV